jgi:hypothetical protein
MYGLHEENSLILVIGLWWKRKEKEKKCELKGRNRRNWENQNWDNPLSCLYGEYKILYMENTSIPLFSFSLTFSILSLNFYIIPLNNIQILNLNYKP